MRFTLFPNRNNKRNITHGNRKIHKFQPRKCKYQNTQTLIKLYIICRNREKFLNVLNLNRYKAFKYSMGQVSFTARTLDVGPKLFQKKFEWNSTYCGRSSLDLRTLFNVEKHQLFIIRRYENEILWRKGHFSIINIFCGQVYILYVKVRNGPMVPNTKPTSTRQTQAEMAG